MNFDQTNLQSQSSNRQFQDSEQYSKLYLHYGKNDKLQQLENKFNSYIKHHRINSKQINSFNSKNYINQQSRHFHDQSLEKQKGFIQKDKKSTEVENQQIKQKKTDFKLFNRQKSKTIQQISNKNNSNSKNQTVFNLKYKGNSIQQQQQKLSGSLFINHHEKSLSESRKKSHSLLSIADQLTNMQNLMKQHLKQKQLIVQQLLKEIQIQKMQKVHLYQINQKLEQELTKIQIQSNNQNKFKFITNDQEINKKLIQVQTQYSNVKATYDKIKKQNQELKKEENILKQTLKIAIENRRKWMIIQKQKCQTKMKSQSFSTNKIKPSCENKKNNQITQKEQKSSQEKLLRKLVSEFQKLKSIVDKRTKKTKKKN